MLEGSTYTGKRFEVLWRSTKSARVALPTRRLWRELSFLFLRFHFIVSNNITITRRIWSDIKIMTRLENATEHEKEKKSSFLTHRTRWKREKGEKSRAWLSAQESNCCGAQCSFVFFCYIRIVFTSMSFQSSTYNNSHYRLCAINRIHRPTSSDNAVKRLPIFHPIRDDNQRKYFSQHFFFIFFHCNHLFHFISHHHQHVAIPQRPRARVVVLHIFPFSSCFDLYIFHVLRFASALLAALIMLSIFHNFFLPFFAH